ncbi:MAG: diacylglycerol/polyprenol kinase family protein [Fidelibacterota bacterium]
MVGSAELLRKLIHLFNLLIPICYLTVVPDRVEMTVAMAAFALVFILIDFARLRIPRVKDIFHQLFNFMMRKHELEGKITGATWAFIISVPVIYFFPKEIAVLSLVFMSVGDTAASIMGQTFGKRFIGSKSLEGTLSCFGACMIVILVFNIVPFYVGLSGAVSAAIFEVLPVNIDDNILIPIGSGTTMLIMSSFIV